MTFPGKNSGTRAWILLVVLAAAAVVVQGTDAVTWTLWGRLKEGAATHPATVCRKLESTPLLEMPAVVTWGRTLVTEPLLREGGRCGRSAVRRLAAALRRWAPVDPSGWVLGARVELMEGRITDGTRLLDRCLRLDPASPYLHRLAALLKMQAGDYDAALDELADAEGIAPGYRVPRVDVLPSDELWIELEGLRRRAALYPRRREEALLSLATRLWALGRHEEARKLLEPLKDRPEVAMTRARWALEEGNASRAERIAGAVATDGLYPRPVRSRAFSVLARALEADGKTKEAMRAAATAVRLDPDSPEPYVALSRLARRRGDMDAALRYMRSAWGVAPSNVRVLLEVAATAEAAGAVSDARLALERAMHLAPGRVDVGTRLVDFLIRHGEYMKAAMVLSTQLKHHPMNPRLIALAAQLQRRTSPGRH